MFCSVKDKISAHQKSNVIYTIKCPGCGEDYVEKTDRCVIIRLSKYSNHSNLKLMLQHLQHCEKILRKIFKKILRF